MVSAMPSDSSANGAGINFFRHWILSKCIANENDCDFFEFSFPPQNGNNLARSAVQENP